MKLEPFNFGCSLELSRLVELGDKVKLVSLLIELGALMFMDRAVLCFAFIFKQT